MQLVAIFYSKLYFGHVDDFLDLNDDSITISREDSSFKWKIKVEMNRQP